MRHHHPVKLDAGWSYVETTYDPETDVFSHQPIGTCADHKPHTTEAKARACYAKVLRGQVHLDGRRMLVDGQPTFDPCRACGQPTARFAWLFSTVTQVALCDEHLTEGNAAEYLIGALAGEYTHV